MGGDGSGRRFAGCRGVALSQIVRVVPDLASFAVDKGFEYDAGDLTPVVGSIVRVPLSGRPRRGFVTASREGDAEGLKAVRSISGDLAVFHPELLTSLRWAAHHYVAPLSVLLGKSAPPNLPRRLAVKALPSIPPASSPLPDVTAAAASGGRGRSVQYLVAGNWSEATRLICTDVLAAGRSVMAVLPTANEAERLSAILRPDFGARVVEVAGDDAKATTAAWVQAASKGGVIVVGTPKVVWWPIAELSLALLFDEGRRGMKERQTPTVSARAAVRARSQVERFPVIHIGRVPTADTLAAGAPVERAGGRLWPLVEVVDRGEDPPGGGILTERARRAVQATQRSGGRVLLFTHRRGYAPAFRCVACRTLRVCPTCGARPDPGAECVRCGAVLGDCAECGGRQFEPLGAAVGRVVDEASRVVGRTAVGPAPTDHPVVVGTERDLVDLGPVDLAVAVDADGLIRGTNYRAGEDALALLARVASSVRAGAGRRMMLQTADPDHPVVEALRRADPVPFLQSELDARAGFGMPPSGEVVVIEIDGASEADEAIRDAVGDAIVFGPAAHRGRSRWLVQGNDLAAAKRALRPVIGAVRDRGSRVRVDVDPRDL